MLAVGSHAITNRKPAYASANFRHCSNIAIAHCKWLIKFVHDGVQCWRQTIGANFFKDLLHLVGLLTGLVQKIGLAKVHHHALGAGGNKCARRMNKQ